MNIQESTQEKNSEKGRFVFIRSAIPKKDNHVRYSAENGYQAA
jgi:hypothetical protein